MKLKQHREDVKDLRLMADAHVQDIARRYLNLIRAFEDEYEGLEGFDFQGSKYLNKVFKDAGLDE